VARSDAEGSIGDYLFRLAGCGRQQVLRRAGRARDDLLRVLQGLPLRGRHLRGALFAAL
jgi:hypothetical protein